MMGLPFRRAEGEAEGVEWERETLLFANRRLGPGRFGDALRANARGPRHREA